jgi:hypothetical protein
MAHHASKKAPVNRVSGPPGGLLRSLNAQVDAPPLGLCANVELIVGLPQRLVSQLASTTHALVPRIQRFPCTQSIERPATRPASKLPPVSQVTLAPNLASRPRRSPRGAFCAAALVGLTGSGEHCVGNIVAGQRVSHDHRQAALEPSLDLNGCNIASLRGLIQPMPAVALNQDKFTFAHMAI